MLNRRIIFSFHNCPPFDDGFHRNTPFWDRNDEACARRSAASNHTIRFTVDLVFRCYSAQKKQQFKSLWQIHCFKLKCLQLVLLCCCGCWCCWWCSCWFFSFTQNPSSKTQKLEIKAILASNGELNYDSKEQRSRTHMHTMHTYVECACVKSAITIISSSSMPSPSSSSSKPLKWWPNREYAKCFTANRWLVKEIMATTITNAYCQYSTVAHTAGPSHFRPQNFMFFNNEIFSYFNKAC